MVRWQTACKPEFPQLPFLCDILRMLMQWISRIHVTQGRGDNTVLHWVAMPLFTLYCVLYPYFSAHSFSQKACGKQHTFVPTAAFYILYLLLFVIALLSPMLVNHAPKTMGYYTHINTHSIYRYSRISHACRYSYPLILHILQLWECLLVLRDSNK